MKENAKESVTQGQVADDFDRVADDYEKQINSAIAFGGREHQFYIDVKRDRILELTQHTLGDLARLDVLDIGCGLGAYHPGLKGVFRELHGVDVSSRSINLARQRHPFVQYKSFDGGALPYANARFDMAFAVCVMHHVPPAGWVQFVQEMGRVLKPGGLALIFEHNPYNPATQYIVRSCEIDKDAVLLRPGQIRKLFRNAAFKDVWTRGMLAVPPVGQILSAADKVLGHVPVGAQYYLAARK
ncbi:MULTISPECIES: class I SAM-dependent methyltransferase [Mesorhizobium]|nr:MULTISPECIES: class I SAM-dependent methyltransferase [Mesorhizobium]